MARNDELRRIIRLRALGRWVGEWQELLIWLPVVLIAAWIAWRGIPLIDRTAGLDGWGIFWGYLVTGAGVCVAAFLAWLITRTYHLDFDDEDERELIDYAAGIDRTEQGIAFGFGVPSWPAAAIWLGNRLFFLVLFVIILRVLVP